MGSTPAGVISKEPRASVDESNRVEEIQCVSVCDNWWYIEGAKVGQNSKIKLW